MEYLLSETNAAGVCTITLNRPTKLNAINMQLANELPQALEAASKDDSIRVVVVTGAGRGFCAGLDLDPISLGEQMMAMQKDRAGRLEELGWVGRQTLALVNCDKPIIAAINGPAAGAGLGLALASDIRVMRADAVLTTGYIRRGLSPDAGVSYFLPRLIGLSRASELILTARDIKADEAERIGLVSQVLPAEGFMEAVANLALMVAAGPPLALTLAKRLLNASQETDLVTQLKAEFEMIKKCFASEDVVEAMRAFGEKRPPQFKGN